MSYADVLSYAEQLDSPTAFLKRSDAEKWKVLVTYLKTKDASKIAQPEPQAQSGEPEPAYKVRPYSSVTGEKVSAAQDFYSAEQYREAIAKKDAEAAELRAALVGCVEALKRLLSSDPEGAIANASEEDLTFAANDIEAHPIVREQAAAILQSRAAITQAQEVLG